ncbi:MAG: MYG1 family protein [Patescibacteria group bacterium]
MITVVTHSGRFHADEVLALAVLRLVLKSEINIIRTRDISAIEKADYVVDVGRIYDPEKNRFDHHQEGGAEAREDGIPYASFGLVWKKFGDTLCNSKEVAAIIEKKIVEPVDANDNGISLCECPKDIAPYRFQDVIFSLSPTWKESEHDIDTAFLDAISIAERVLLREIKKAQDSVLGSKIVEQMYHNTPNKKVLVMDMHYPYEEIIEKLPELLFVVYPDFQGSMWKVEAVPDDIKTYTSRKKFPVAWAGKEGEELATISGVSDASFCHNAGFLAVAKSKEGALKLAERALASS